MSEQRRSLSPAERDRLLIRDLVFAPPGPGITGTLEELQAHYRDAPHVIRTLQALQQRYPVASSRGAEVNVLRVEDPDTRRNTAAVGPSSIGKRTSDKGDCD